MTEQEEQFVHLVSSIRDLNNAWRLLQEIKRCKEGAALVGAAFRYALIEYSKPYRDSRGSVPDSKGRISRHKLDERYVPVAYCRLHKRILHARDQIHAHSDLTVREAKLYVTNTSAGKIATIVENNLYGTEDLRHIDEIIGLIEGTLDSLYIEEKRLEAQLPAAH